MQCLTCGAQLDNNATSCAACGADCVQSGSNGSYAPVLPENSRLQGGAFAVKEVLGQGGFGITYRGGDMKLRRYVAIKEFFPFGSHRQGTTVMPPSGAKPESYAQARQGFVREAMTLARFNHSGIVRVFGAFEENNTAYMVMELLEGRSLQTVLNEKGVLPEREAIRLTAQVGEALATIHAAKLLHRDIKPDNIILVPQESGESRAVLIDFGTAREFSTDRTKAMTAMVTHGYAPLEQYAQKARFGTYTDVYALGATLYHCLTGRLPISAMDRLAGVELPSPEAVNPNLSRGVSDAVMWALQPKAGDRPQDIHSWLDRLQNPPAPNTSPHVSTHNAGSGRPQAVLPTLTPNGAPTPTVVVPQQTTVLPPPTTPNAHPRSDSSLYSQKCPHCGVGMSYLMTICPSCRRKNTTAPGAADSDFSLPERHPETAFDRFMFSVPRAVWRVLGAVILILVVGRTTLGIVRYQNGSRDFGDELAKKFLLEPETQNLTEATLELGEGTFDDKQLARRHDDYEGRVRYADGDVGVLNLDVTERDWLYRPLEYSYDFLPMDFGSFLAGQIRSDMNERLRRNDEKLLVTDMNLSRQTRTYYRGTFIVDNEFKHPVGISVTVESFDEDGTPATWSYNVD